jgi:hypothetical protein
MSTDRNTALQAGKTAHAIASFLADERRTVVDSPSNPALWKAYADSLIPYLGATVGDNTGVAGFAPLDGLDSSMPRTSSLFASMTKDDDANRRFAGSATTRADGYEEAFATEVVADPPTARSPRPQSNLSAAARLHALVASGAHQAHPETSRPTALRAQTRLAYTVARLKARAGDPTIDPKFFDDSGRLIPPDHIDDSDWSIYDSQLSVFLAPWPPITDAIRQFGRTFDRIVRG